MKTLILKINKNKPEKEKIDKAAKVLKNGGTVAFPTETVYGLGANALDKTSIAKIFKAKGRPQDNPLIVHIADTNKLYDLVDDIPKKAKVLMDKFWPGPLTIIFNRNENVPDEVTAGLDTVAIRNPDNLIAKALLKSADLPIAAPSANTSGKPSPTDSKHVLEDLDGKVDIIIDGGLTGVGVESTVLDISGDIPTILRPGGITKEDLLTVFDEVKYDPALKNKDFKPKSPGQKYRHYSPKGEVKIVKGDIGKVIKKINSLTKEYESKNIKVGIMATLETSDKYQCENVVSVGSRKDFKTIAANLFKTLRYFDEIGVDIILAEAIDELGIGSAVMNRLTKASGGNIIIT
ncbi:MAG: threonylcarbamoyl-AMP synthase [Firmicutes bacterium]|nr:threonylcarbamoyl-AMP synthase [Bacillota bacterium]